MADDLHNTSRSTARATESALALPERTDIIGYVDPLIGRVALRDVSGYYGFPLIKKGQTVTRPIAERAESLGRLFELVEATDDVSRMQL
jgi:hypothetical protein